MSIHLMGRAGLKIRASDGFEELGYENFLSTPLFYYGKTGNSLTLLDKNYMFNIATYSPIIDPKWIYTYTYAPDQSWTKYNEDLHEDGYRQDDYIFDHEDFFRICIKRVNSEPFYGSEDINNIISFNGEEPTYTSKPWLIDEVTEVADCVQSLRSLDSKIFIVLSDTHYNVNGTWNDTQDAINRLSALLPLDGILHLGDLTDGMVTQDATSYYVSSMIDGLKNKGVPVWISLGNHDANYHRDNKEPFTLAQQRELYLSGGKTCYYEDFDEFRLICVDSFRDNERLRYGFSQTSIDWLEETLNNTHPDMKVIIFSHLPPLTRLQFWPKTIRGEERLQVILKDNSFRILAWINGHNHADHIDNLEGYPVISIGNAKCEAYLKHKTHEFVTPNRKLDDVTQELFDIMIVDAKDGTIKFKRFGAGNDKMIKNNKGNWL